jgi:hypothetical protein
MLCFGIGRLLFEQNKPGCGAAGGGCFFGRPEGAVFLGSKGGKGGVGCELLF